MAINFSKRYFKKIPILATTSVIVASVGSFFIEFIPHSILLSKYKNIAQLKKFEKPVPLTKKVENLFNEVLNDLNIKEKKKLYNPFASIGFDLIHAGLNSYRYGSIIGIPVNYTYEDKLSINASEIRIGYNQERLNIYHPSANDLLDSLLLSDKAKKFGIAREVLMINKNLPIYYSTETPVMIIVTVLAGVFLKIKFSKSFKLSSPMRVTIFGITGLLGYSLWFQIRDSIHTYFEKSVDKELAKLKPDYFEGGKEFYEKLLKRNVALRTLLGHHGAKEFNKDGDEIIFIRRKRTPLTERKQLFNNFTISEGKQYTA